MNSEAFDERSKSAWVVINNWKTFCKELRTEIAALNAENARLKAEVMTLRKVNAAHKAGMYRAIADAERYRYLRERDLDTIEKGGVFAGRTPDDVVLNGADLDNAIDNALKEQK